MAAAVAVHTSLQQVHGLCSILQYPTMLLAGATIAYGRNVAQMTVWWGFV